MAELNIEKMTQSVAKRAIQELRDSGVFISRWIPVSERLPEEEYENYLISTNEGEVDIGNYGSEKGWSMCDADGFYYPRHKGIEIVAWMPLPKPYESQESEE